ncbi:Aristolochene synthase [Durotheca rogersii]|uniref:Aristolochene synthase n=1 Tax=Durotheca rogersii TaxID=419775 RepID=UPI00221FF90E|nr:Aristolochene synthase [Durotheca rogersii]KAI5862641.1 Aristolochene synthase [Durotheca rogersii]
MKSLEPSVLSQCHPRADEVVRDVQDFFLEHWDFPDEKSRGKFAAEGVARMCCITYPKARDDRIELVCKLITLLFLTDGELSPPALDAEETRYAHRNNPGILDYKSFRDGAAFNLRLMSLFRGDARPDRSLPVESIAYDVMESMQACDRVLPDDLLEPTAQFLQSQTDEVRAQTTSLRQYLSYRMIDCGHYLLTSLMRFSMGLHVTPAESPAALEAETICGYHISVVHDIWSFEKEVRCAQHSHAEGATPCNAVSVQTSLPPSACKRVLSHICREWEERHRDLTSEFLQGGRSSPDMPAYV